jgi:hypothetical protein
MFKTMTTLLNTQKPSKEEIEKIPSYIMLRWLSNNQHTVIPANMMNINHHLPIYNQYIFLDDYFNLSKIKNKIKYIKYNKTQENENKIVNNIMNYYNINQQLAEKYFKMLPEKERKHFEEMYNEGRV